MPRRRRKRELNQEDFQEAKDFLDKCKEGIECEYCGEDHPACLEFHHKEPNKKRFNISSAPHKGFNKKEIEKEVSKCIVLCSNCHKKWHWEND